MSTHDESEREELDKDQERVIAALRQLYRALNTLNKLPEAQSEAAEDREEALIEPLIWGFKDDFHAYYGKILQEAKESIDELSNGKLLDLEVLTNKVWDYERRVEFLSESPMWEAMSEKHEMRAREE